MRFMRAIWGSKRAGVMVGNYIIVPFRLRPGNAATRHYEWGIYTVARFHWREIAVVLRSHQFGISIYW